MNPAARTLNPNRLSVLLRGEADPLDQVTHERALGRVGVYLAVIALGAGCFGAAVGSWRDPLQAAYTAIKFPLILLLTSLGNALLNGMLAQLLGLNVSFRQSFLAILMSFTIAAAILGSFSPITFFMVWNTPASAERAELSVAAHGFILMSQVLVIAFAGVAANLRLLQLLRRWSGNARVAWRILFGWLAGNLLLGAQISWLLRPFVGSPGLPVQFLRPDAWDGNFFESFFRAVRHVFF